MAETSSTPEKQANTAVPHNAPHDRVQMLSLRADGTPDQYNPEIIGDKEAATEAAKEQFKQQAVSAVDFQQAPTGPVTLVGQKDGTVKEVSADEVPQDPSIEAAQKEHEKAERAAERAVSSLHEG